MKEESGAGMRREEEGKGEESRLRRVEYYSKISKVDGVKGRGRAMKESKKRQGRAKGVRSKAGHGMETFEMEREMERGGGGAGREQSV
jgi:hypothetical protein